MDDADKGGGRGARRLLDDEDEGMTLEVVDVVEGGERSDGWSEGRRVEVRLVAIM
jgi:hypothetical protein